MEKHCKDCTWNRPGWPIMDDRCGHAEGMECGKEGRLFEAKVRAFTQRIVRLGIALVSLAVLGFALLCLAALIFG